MASLCHPWFTTANLSYRFPIFETSATALCGTTGIFYDIFATGFTPSFLCNIGGILHLWNQRGLGHVSWFSYSIYFILIACTYHSILYPSIRSRGLAVKQLGAQGLCSKVTTRAWGPPKHQPHLRTHTNAKPTNNDNPKSDSHPLQYAVRKANNKIKIAENPAIVAVACQCVLACPGQLTQKTRQNNPKYLTYLGQRALLWQWYLRHPFFSCEQHQSFLESDHPCFQLENPARQS